MSRRVLVTGAGGFIGRHLVRRLLARRMAVIAVDVNLRALDGLRDDALLRTVSVDIRRSDSIANLLDNVDIVYHLAAAHLEVGLSDEYFRDINVESLGHLARASAQAGITRFVHCSTTGVYGPLNRLPADETTPCRPEISYEMTKLEGENVVRNVARELDLSAVIIRPAWVYGPECPRTLKLIRALVGRRFFFVGRGDNLRHPVFIDDMLRAFELAATAPVTTGEILIIAGPEPVTTRQLIEKILAIAGVEYEPPTLPMAPVVLACMLTEVAFKIVRKQPPFSRRSIKFFTESAAFHTAKAHEMLGFRASTSLDDGLAKTISYAREHGLL